jgi:hypothetical protein
MIRPTAEPKHSTQIYRNINGNGLVHQQPAECTPLYSNETTHLNCNNSFELQKEDSKIKDSGGVFEDELLKHSHEIKESNDSNDFKTFEHLSDSDETPQNVNGHSNCYTRNGSVVKTAVNGKK